MMCYISVVRAFLIHNDFYYGLLRLPDLKIELTVGVTGRQGMVTPARHLIQPLVYPGIHV
jgi:hypothetical protein